MELTLSNITGNLYGIAAIIASPILGIPGLLFLFSEPTWGIPLIIAAIAAFVAGVLALPVVRRGLDSKLNISMSKYAAGGLVGGFSIVSLLAVLVTTALIVGAGMAGPGFQQAGDDAWTDVQTNQAGTQAQGTITLEEGTYAVYTFSGQTSFTVDITVDVPSDKTVDVMVIQDGEFDRFRDQQSVTTSAALSQPDTTGYSASNQLAAGNYVLIIDNTAYGQARPDGSVDVDLDFEIR